ncbi:MAG: carboxypeptidase-like regulatory domain-containing protein, partial [Candidatus Methanosuratincola sp.]
MNRTQRKHLMTMTAFLLSLLLSFLLLPLSAHALPKGGGEGIVNEEESSAQIMSEPVQMWQRTYPGDLVSSVQQTADGGYVLAGSAGSDAYIVRTDPCGNLLWQKTFGGSSSDEATFVRQTSDGGYIIAGGTTSFGAGDCDVYLVKTDPYGNLLWQKTFGGCSWDWAHCVQQTNDNGYIIAGGSSSFSGGESDTYLLKTDASGNLLWERTFSVDEGQYFERAGSVQQTSDGGYILAVELYGSAGCDAYLLKTDSYGNLLWEKAFGGANYDRAEFAQQTSDGGYILAGLTSSYGAGGCDAYLVKTDAYGNLLWQTAIGGSSYDEAICTQQTSDGGYILAGLTDSYGAGGGDAYLVKTDAYGNLLWQKAFGGANWDWARSVDQTQDGGYVLAGHTESFGAGGVYLVKTDSEGNTGPYLNDAMISGKVEDIYGNPIPDAVVTAFSVNTATPKGTTITASDGSYQLSLPEGSYKLRFSKEENYETQFYCEKRNFSSADLVSAISGSITENINARLMPKSEESARLKAALDSYKEAILYKLDRELMWATNAWCVGTLALQRAGGDWVQHAASFLHFAKQVAGKDLHEPMGFAKNVLIPFLKSNYESFGRYAPGFNKAFTAVDWATGLISLAKIEARRYKWTHMADSYYYRNYLEREKWFDRGICIQKLQYFNDAFPVSSARGISGVAAEIQALFENFDIPEVLPPDFPIDSIIANLDQQTEVLRKSAANPEGRLRWPAYFCGGEHVFTEFMNYVRLRNDVIESMALAAAYGGIVLQHYAAFSFITATGAALTGVAATFAEPILLLVTSEAGIARATWGTVVGVVESLIDFDYTSNYPEQLFQELEDLEDWVFKDVGTVWEAAEDTLNYIQWKVGEGSYVARIDNSLTSNSLTSGLLSLPQVTVDGSLSITSVSADDVVLTPDDDVGVAKVSFTLTNQSSEPISVIPHCSILTRNEWSHIDALEIDGDATTVPAGGNADVEFDLILPRSSSKEISGYELVFSANPTYFSGEDAVVVGPALAHIHVGTEEELQAYSHQEWSILLEDDLEEGEVAQTTLDLTSGTRMARLLLPEMSPCAFYLEVRDSQGRRIAYDLESGEHTVEIPGARAELSSSYKFVELPGGDTYTITVTGAQIEESSHLV